MKQISKRLLGAFLAIIMVVSMVPNSIKASATNASTQSAITTGSIITYGSYPQTKVTSSSLISALNAQTLQADNTVTYGGSKYKRVYFTQYTPSYNTSFPITNYSYQDDNGYYINTVYWFKYEPIQWRVLSNTNGELFVMADKILDSRAYNQVDTNVTWETCTMRSWLNNDFYNTAFISSEQAKIERSTVVNSDNSWYGTNGGNNTNDKLFLLSYADTINSAYGFSSSYDTTDTARQAQGTDYAKSSGLCVPTGGSYSYWRLRSPGNGPTYAGIVSYNGIAGHDALNYIMYHNYVYRTDFGARPVLKLNLTAIQNSIYNIKIIDNITSLPVPGATVSFNGICYQSQKDGTVKIEVGNLPSVENQNITVTENGYKTLETSLLRLDSHAQSIISLEPDNSLASLIPDISTDSENIKGPTIKFMGKSFPLFSFDGKIDLPLNSYIQTINDAQNKTYKVLIGFDKDKPIDENQFNNVKDFFQGVGNGNSADAEKMFTTGLKDKLAKIEPKFGVQCTGSIAGFVEFDYSTGKLVKTSGGIVFTFEATVSQSIPFTPCPIFYEKFELSGSIETSLSWVFSGSGVLGFNADIEYQLKPKVGVGVGNDNLVCLEVGVKGTVSGKVKFNASLLTSPSLKDMFEAYLEAQLYIKAKALFFESEVDTNFPHLELYPDFGITNAQDKSLQISKASMTMMSRDYLNTQPKQTRNKSATVTSIDKQSVYPYGSPQLIKLANGNTLALWNDDDGTKSIANRTTLFYSIYNGSVWTTPAAVCDSGLTDFSATVCTNGSNVGILWQRGSEVFDNDVTLDEMLANTDLVYSSFDGTSFSTPQIMGTPNNGKYEMGYSIASNGTDLTVVWIENSANDFSMFSGTNAVYAQTISNGVPQAIETVNSNVPGISSLAIGYTLNGREIAYCADTDGDLTTTGDSELFVNNVNVTNNAVDDLNVKFENGSFWYKSNGELVKLNDDYSATDTGIAFDGNYNIVSNGTSTAAVFTQSDDFSNQVMISNQNTDGTFTAPVSLYNNGTMVNAFSAVMNSSGSVTMAMNSKNLSTDPEALTPYTTTDFLVKDFGDSFDLAIGDSLSYDRTTVAPGAAVDLTTTVKNNSTAAVSGYTLTLTDSSNNVLATKTVNDSIASGAEVDASITYTLPSTLVGQTIKLSVTPVGVVDADTSNNSVTTQIGLGDLTVAATIEQNAGEALITATITNSGYTTIDASSVSFTKIATEMDLLNTTAIGSLAPGQSAVVTYQVSSDKIAFLSEYTDNSFVVDASTTSDENDLANNDTTVSISPVRAQSLSISDDSLTLAVGEGYALTASVAPMNAINRTVYFVSDSTDVATVDDNGNITAVGIGTAIITVISSDGGIVKSCAVTVQSNKLAAADNSALFLNRTNGFITNLTIGQATVADVKLQIANSKVRFLDKDGNILTDTGTAGTGTRIQLLNNSGVVLDELKIVIYGDVNGDGNIDSIDAGNIVDYQNYMINWDPLTDATLYKAGDLNGDGNIDSIDAGLAVDAQNYMVTIDQSTGLAT